MSIAYAKGELIIGDCESIFSANLTFDGHDMWPILKGEKKPDHDEIVLNIDVLRNMSALRKGDWKVIEGRFYFG